MGKVIIGKYEVAFEDIKNGKWPACPSYFDDSLLFCKAWLNGQEAFQLKTSGSTGKPKIIVVSRHQMELSSSATGSFFNMPPAANLFCCLNTAMIAGKMMLVRGMEWDSTINLEEPSGLPLTPFPEGGFFDFVAMVPAQVERSLSDSTERKKLGSIRNLIIGGAPLSQNLQKAISQLPCNAYQTYGMTETVSHIALAKISGQPPLIYQTLPGVQISITKDGKLTINAPMAEGPLVTNDFAEIVTPNQFIWKGRADFTINSGGIKIQPENIETTIAPVMEKHLPGKRYFIAGAPSEKWGQEIVLVVETTPLKESDKLTLTAKISKAIKKYEQPKKILSLENFIETPSGKIKRAENLNQALNKRGLY